MLIQKFRRLYSRSRLRISVHGMTVPRRWRAREVIRTMTGPAPQQRNPAYDRGRSPNKTDLAKRGAAFVPGHHTQEYKDDPCEKGEDPVERAESELDVAGFRPSTLLQYR